MLEKLGTYVVWIVLVIVGIIIKAFVIAKLWFWFIADAFTTIELSMTHAIGIAVMVIYVMTKPLRDMEEDHQTVEDHFARKKTTAEKAINRFFNLLLWSGLILFVGYIITYFI